MCCVKILFVCEYNACRSQIAEGLARALLPENFSITSAGIYPGELNWVTIEVMKEIGIDISTQRSKLLAEVLDRRFDQVIVLAEAAWRAVEMLKTDHKLLWPFPDPACDPGDAEAVKGRIRRVRDQLRERILTL